MMKQLLLFLLLSSQALTAGPRLRIVVGNEGWDALTGLIGVAPQSSGFGAMTIASLGPRDSRFLVFNLQLVNEGDEVWDPSKVRPASVQYDLWSETESVRGFWRFTLMDLSSNVLARFTAPASYTYWDLIPFRTNAAPRPKFGWNEPGLSPGWAAAIADSVPAWAFLDITDTPPVGEFYLIIEADRFGQQHTSVTLLINIVYRNIGDISVIDPPPEPEE